MNTHHQNLSLSADEREEMRAEMRGFMAAHPVRERAPFFSPRFLRLAVPVAGFLVVCSGTAFAAEQSLPNDALYPVKVSVLEPLAARTLAYSPASEARFSGALAERRLQEAEALIAQDRLDPETASEMAASIARHADDAQASLKEAASTGDPVEAVRASTDIQARLSAHSAVLEDLADGAPVADVVSDAVAAQADETEKLGTMIEKHLDDVSERDADMLAYDTMNEGQAAIAEAADALGAAPGGTDLTGEATGLVAEARLAFDDGTALLNAGDDMAGDRFQDALRLARQARIVLESQDDISGE